MRVIKESHVHELTEQQLAAVVERFKDRDSFFKQEWLLPDGLGTVPCRLYGPLMGDEPPRVWFYGRRGDRRYSSRLVEAPSRGTRVVTVIAGPHEGEPCVLFTVFGGPIAPREPGDPSISNGIDLHESVSFWAQHALAFDAQHDVRTLERHVLRIGQVERAGEMIDVRQLDSGELEWFRDSHYFLMPRELLAEVRWAS